MLFYLKVVADLEINLRMSYWPLLISRSIGREDYIGTWTGNRYEIRPDLISLGRDWVGVGFWHYT